MSKYRVLAYFHGRNRREAWAIVAAKSPQEAIEKAKADEKAIHRKYSKTKFKSAASGWIAQKVSSNTKATKLF